MPLFWVRRKVIWGSDTNNQLPTKDKNNQKSIKAKNEPQQNREIYDFPEATRGLINFFFRIDIETRVAVFSNSETFTTSLMANTSQWEDYWLLHIYRFSQKIKASSSLESEKLLYAGRLTKTTKNDLWGKYFDRLWIGGTWPVSICARLASTRIINYIPMTERNCPERSSRRRGKEIFGL